jgi:acyl-CoA thioester hydrolase
LPSTRTETLVLKEYPVVVDVVVRWGDMDNLGHVNNIIYLQYFETARIEYLMRLGMEPPGPVWREYGLIMASLSCRFKAPVTFPDTLSIGARIAGIGDDHVLMEHAAFSHKLDTTVTTGDAVIVSYDYVDGKRTSLHLDVRDAIVALEGREPPKLPPRGRAARSSE